MKKYTNIISAIFALLLCSIAGAQTLPIYVPETGLIAWYPFSGNALDSSGNGYNGTVAGATLTTDRFGNANGAYLFNGSSKISTLLVPPMGNAARTISCWFKYSSLPNPCGDNGMCIVGYGGNTRYCTQACRNFSLEVSYTPPTARVDGICIATGESGITDTLDNNWHFFAAVYEPAWGDFYNIKLYVDGAFRATSTSVFGGTSVVNTDSLTKMEIGKGHYECPRYFNGKIDEIGVWNRALNDSELLELYRSMPTAASANMAVSINNSCGGMNFKVLTNSWYAGQHIKTYFGNGIYADTMTVSYGTRGKAEFFKPYNTGVYTVKHVLYNGTVAVDSLIYSRNFSACQNFGLKFYYDANNNCVRDGSEVYASQPVTIEVDSSGVAIDTIPATSGSYYKAYGSVGTIYQFKISSHVPGFVATCPASGIVTDTIKSIGYSSTKYLGFSCSSAPGFDLRTFASFRAGAHHFGGTIIADNIYCSPQNAILTMQMSPKYNSSAYFSPPPTSISGNIASWNISALSSVLSVPAVIHAEMEGAGSFGDTVETRYTINPITGDANTTDNMIIRIDTVKAGYDPNDISVNPNNCIAPGTNNLEYTIRFENTGNDTAYNVYVLDTLPDNLNSKSISIVTASATMNTSIIRSGGYNILKFDFPNINLLDSSHHGFCDGLVIFNINLKNGIANGTTIFNRAGIYFDYNPVVLTNTAMNVIGCPTGVAEVDNTNKVAVYPNPVGDVLHIETTNNQHETCVVSNSIGQLLIQQQLNSRQTNVDVKMLPAGLYYITLKGSGGSVVKKFVKM